MKHGVRIWGSPLCNAHPTLELKVHQVMYIQQQRFDKEEELDCNSTDLSSWASNNLFE